MTSAIHPAYAKAYPETHASGFSHDDVEIAFGLQVKSLLKPDMRVLDFGAGRGHWFEDDQVPMRKQIQLLKGQCREVVGCDVDEAVHSNRAVDQTVSFDPQKPLPFEDDSFDLIVSRYVFEHVTDPDFTASELMRITRPGGWICALTPNKWSYVAIAARLVPNASHAKLIESVQPGGRDGADVFPTRYRLNTLGALRRAFGRNANIHVQKLSGPPAYYFGRGWLFAIFQLVHKIQPSSFHTALMCFIQKKP
jgi:SAM-dependent methyltransferase